MDGEALAGAHGAGWKERLCEAREQEAWPRAEGLEEGMVGQVWVPWMAVVRGWTVEVQALDG